MKEKTRLKELREKKGLSQRELAKILDVANSQISRYEKGTSMTDETIKKICKALEVNADYFLGLTEDIVEKDWEFLSLFFHDMVYTSWFFAKICSYYKQITNFLAD